MFLKQILSQRYDYEVYMKSTQCGISEALLIKTFDELELGRDIFYVLPTDNLKNRFVQNRFNRSVKFTPYYQKLKDDTKSTESVSLKTYGDGVVAFAGSNTPVPFTEFPADTYVVDEKDQCDQKHLLMGEERLGHADSPRRIYVSNPTIEEFGIHLDFKDSSMSEWFIKCSSCGKYIHPDFMVHVVKQVEDNEYIVLDNDWDGSGFVDAKPICEHCNRPFDRFVDGEWVDYKKSHIFGTHISQMFSSSVSINEQVDKFSKAISNPTKMERFYNSCLGLPYTSEGAKISQSLLYSCIGDHIINESWGASSMVNKDDVVVMGVDVGTKLHITIGKLTPDKKVIILFIGFRSDIREIMSLIKVFRVKMGVIDGNPERRLSVKFISALKTGFMCFYGQVKQQIVDMKNKSITIDRTESLDGVLEGFITKNIILPKNMAHLPEFMEHMTASTRVYNEDKQLYQWVCSGADHLFHSMNYLLIARRLILMIANRGKK